MTTKAQTRFQILNTVLERGPGEESAEMYERPRKSGTVAKVWFDDVDGSEPFLVLTSHPGDEVAGDSIKLDQIGISHISFTAAMSGLGEDVRAIAQKLEFKEVPLAGKIEDTPLKAISGPYLFTILMGFWFNSTKAAVAIGKF